MFAAGPLNNAYLELFGATARMTSVPGALDDNARTLELFVDFMPLAFPTAAVPTFMSPVTTTNASPSLDVEVPVTNTAAEAPMEFTVARGATYKFSAPGTIYLGKRHTFLGLDNGTNVFAWLDGAALGSEPGQADWTAAEAALPIESGPDYFIGFDNFSTKYWPMRLYEMWLKINGSLILHYRPKPYMRSGTEIPDLSQFGIDGTITGTEGTDWRIAEAFATSPPLLSVVGA